MEILAIAITNQENIKGISINGIERKLLQFTDDTTAILSDLDSGFWILETCTLSTGDLYLLHWRLVPSPLETTREATREYKSPVEATREYKSPVEATREYKSPVEATRE